MDKRTALCNSEMVYLNSASDLQFRFQINFYISKLLHHSIETSANFQDSFAGDWSVLCHDGLCPLHA